MVNLDAGDQHRLAAGIEHGGSFVRRFIDLSRVGLLEAEAAVPFDEFLGDFDSPVNHVAMNLDSAGRRGPDGFDDAM